MLELIGNLGVIRIFIVKQKSISHGKGLTFGKLEFTIAAAFLRPKWIGSDESIIPGMPPGLGASVFWVRENSDASRLAFDLAMIVKPISSLTPNLFPSDPIAIFSTAEDFLYAFSGCRFKPCLLYTSPSPRDA